MTNQNVSVAKQLDPGTKLAIPLGTRLLIQIDGREEKHSTELVGALPYDFLLMRLPMVPGIRGMMEEGQKVIVRYMTHGVIYGFTSRVQRQQVKPVPLVFVEYPESVEEFALRKQVRVSCRIPCEIDCVHGKYRGVITDLSTGGCLVQLDVPIDNPMHELQAEESIVLSAAIFAGQDEKQITSLCRNVEVEKTTLKIGVAFSGLETETVRKLGEFISTTSCFV